MGAPPLPRSFRGKRATHDALREFVDTVLPRGASGGHDGRLHVVGLTGPVARLLGREPGTAVTVRLRRTGVLPAGVRTWHDEPAVLRAVREVLPHVPECLADREDFAVHGCVDGVPLSGVRGDGRPLDALLVGALADLFARLARVRRAALPPLPAGRTRNDTDSREFLRTVAGLAARQVGAPEWAAFGGLFAALGIPDDALPGLAERVPAMTRRPYGLLHTDLRRDNVFVSYDGVPPLVCVGWEFAGYGDPLHDLATHLVRMKYPPDQWTQVVEAWERAVRAVRPAAVAGLGRDLDHYVALERARSVYPAVMRAARSLEESFTQQRLDDATAEVRRCLEEAAEPLRLRNVPGDGEIERTLFRWLASRPPAERGGRRPVTRTLVWEPDRRVPEHPEFPARLVREALVAEGAAPASRVFKGAAHLNTVVRVPGFATPVVVRRELPDVCRRERSFLSEHAVLRAIEQAGVEVAAPRVLALGESRPSDRFAVHTYVGPDADRPPHHPVHGLLPHEADRLVDQLCALRHVDYKQVDPTAGEGGFHRWLCDQLVSLVRELPKESQQVARLLGLPDADRLGQILARRRVTHREPSLLHGDLNPWNLVRRDDDLALTVIDWEMALVGDPLYDLVRHMHLTPTRPEIRDRMFRRWERLLPAAYTRGWREDWRVYGRLEIVRSAYVDLDRIVTGTGLDAPNVRRAVDSYPVTLAVATGSLGLPVRTTANPYLARALA